MTDLVELERRGVVAHLTLNSPSSLNALSDAMLAALKARFTEIAASTEIKAVVLKGAGKVFCAGHDLKEMQAGRESDDKGRAYFADLFARCSEVMLMIPKMPQPVIAEVHGIATAAGCQLVASCDMAVAAEGTRFGVNGVNIGLFCSTPMVALARNVPRKVAFEMLTTGEFINSTRAREVGLVNRVVPHDQLDAEASHLAETVAAKLSLAVKVGKRAFYEQITMDTRAAYEHASAVMVENMLARDTAEGVQAFIEKRKPDWAE